MRASWSATTIAAAAAGRQADEGHAGGDYRASLPRRHIPNWAAGGTRDLSLLACGECFISCTIRACTAGLGLRQVNECPRACDIALWRPRGVLPRFPQNAESRVWCASRVSLRYTRQTASQPRVAESHLARLGLGKTHASSCCLFVFRDWGASTKHKVHFPTSRGQGATGQEPFPG